MSHILIVDDKEPNRYWLSALLQGHGYAIEAAGHGAEALVKARLSPPCLVITDLLMPVMDGYSLLRRWKTDEQLKSIPVVVYTATYTQPEDERLARELGADAFILKPSEPGPLIACIEEVLAAVPQGSRASTISQHQAVAQYESVVVRKLEEKARQLEQANRELAASEARLRTMLDTEPECVKVVDPKGRLLEMNPAGLAMLEVNSLAEAQRCPLSEYILREHRPAFQDLHRRVMRGERGKVEFEIEGRRGTRRWMETNAVPLRDKDGLVMGLLGVTRDVSARKQSERDRAQTQLFRELLDRTTDLVYIADAASGRLMDCNEALPRRLGYAREGILQMCVLDFSTPREPIGSWSEGMALLQSAGSQGLTASEYRCSDGSSVPVEVSLSYVVRDAQPVLVAVARDVTERRRQELQIAHLTRILRMQSGIKAAALQISDAGEMLCEACRVATDIGGYEHTLIVQIESDGHRVREVYQAGKSGFPKVPPFDIGDGSEFDQGVTGRALCKGEIVICNDLTRHAEPAVFARERLISLGIRSIVALPLIVDGMSAGALTLLSRNVERVADEELALLQDVAATLAFGLRSRRHAHAAEFLTYYDPLTGLAKRGLFCERLDEVMRQRSLKVAQPVIVAFDVHDLSGINDTFGRAAGDVLVREVAERVRLAAPSEQVGHLGGGTFALALFEQQGAGEGVIALLESVVFVEPFEIQGRKFRVTYRSGLAQYPADGRTAAALVEKAEAALRHAKESGERYLHFKLQMHSEVSARLQLESELREAVDRGEFVLHYQPQVDIATGRIESVEALIRWRRPEALLPPAQFLPVLESSGLIVPVGSWVLAQAAKDCRDLRARAIGPLRIAVNVSAQQIRRRGFVEDVLRSIAGWSNADYGLDIEITETSLLQDLEETSRKLHALREAGVRIAIDDFGTGYSSLGLLPTLPIDILKIDRVFVRGLPQDHASISLTSSIIQIASAFDLATVAEGVETVEQLALLRELRCGHSQGYLHSRPVPLEELEPAFVKQ